MVSESIASQSDMCLAAVGDKSLVAAAKSGELSAYGELCRRHSKRLLRTVQRITRNVDDAEDAVQDSLMKAFAHLESFDGRSAFSTWLTRIAINSALMMMRKRRRAVECSLDSFDDSGPSRMPEMIEPSSGPEDIFLQHERERKLHHAVSHLSPNLRGVMEICESTDASMKEIATGLGISVSATKSRLLRAKAALRVSLTRMQRGAHPTHSSRPIGDREFDTEQAVREVARYSETARSQGEDVGRQA
jgi:RNA polymerase sigma factor (sigma-70 family)